MPRAICVAITLAAVFLSACGLSKPAANVATADASHSDPKVAAIAEIIPKLKPFFDPMGEPQRYDWLGTNREPGQTFVEYTQANPTLPTEARNIIYFREIGPLSAKQSKIIRQTAEYVSAFYGIEHKFLPPERIDVNSKRIADDTRAAAAGGQRQLRSGYVLDNILLPSLPKNAAVLVGVTAIDLYPDASMSYVFGQGRFADRVAILSVHRLAKNADSQKFLTRSIKLATHEIGHAFSFRHCTMYECLMSGTNHLAETDRRPIDACPECTAKVLFIREHQTAARYRKLSQTATQLGLTQDAKTFTQKAQAVTK